MFISIKIDLFSSQVLFPNTGHVIIPLRTVPFKFHLIHVHIRAYLVKFPWDLYWENKTHKIKRSIAREKLTICTSPIIHLVLHEHCFQFPLDRCNPKE